MTADHQEPEPAYRQNVWVKAGITYAVSGADMHVFGDGAPRYLLESWPDQRGPEPAWLTHLPGRLLNAQSAAAGFAGRDAELGGLRRWRQSHGRLAVRWLYGRAGKGKTLLAAKFAAASAAENWKVLAATYGPDVRCPVLEGQDLYPRDTAGVLLIVDDADIWPLAHLLLLLSDKLFRLPEIRTRILLIAPTADAWPAIRGRLDPEQPATSSQELT